MADIVDAKFSTDMDLDGIFQELGNECKIAIERKEPEWCSGHIRTIYFDPQEPISLDWIQKKVGGEKLMIRLYGPKTPQNKSGYLTARTVDIMGPPRDGHGIEMVQGPDGKAVKATELELAIQRHAQKLGVINKEAQPVEVPQQISPDMNLFQVLIQSQSKQNNTMLQMMGQRVQSLEQMLYQQQTQQVGPPQDPVAQLKQTLELFTLMDKAKQKIGGPAEPDELSSLLPMVGQIAKGFLDRKTGQPVVAPSKGALVPPKKRMRPGQNPPSGERIPPSGEIDDENSEDTISGLANKLASLSPEDAAEVAGEAIGNMPMDKREKTMEHFIGLMYGDQQVDESSSSDDTISQHEELIDPFSQSKTSPVQIQGGEPYPDAPDSQTDRPSNPQGIDLPTNP